MKKQLLFIAAMLVGLTSATATTAGNAVSNGEDLYTDRYRFAEPIIFIERGVEFLIFPNGSFDFNTEIVNNNSNVFYKSNTRRHSANATYETRGSTKRINYSSPRSRGTIITHDNNGQVRRIGNVFINYDRAGRIKRAGSVYMNYQRGNGFLIQVGGLRVNYNRWGQLVYTSGIVNQYNTVASCDSNFGNYTVAYNDIDNYDDDFYYYRKNGKIKKSKKRK